MEVFWPESKFTDFLIFKLITAVIFNPYLLHVNPEKKELKVVTTHEQNLRLKIQTLNATFISHLCVDVHLLSKRLSNPFNIDHRWGFRSNFIKIVKFVARHGTTRSRLKSLAAKLKSVPLLAEIYPVPFILSQIMLIGSSA